MPRLCAICQHEQRRDIDKALVTGGAYPLIAAKYGVSQDSVRRHKGHLPARLVKAQDAAEVAEADDLLAQVRTLQTRALGILDTAEGTGQLMAALGAIREARGCLELLAKLLGELDERPQINVLVSPEWHQVRGVLLTTLQPYPDARAAVAGALVTLDSRNGHAD